LFLSLTPLNQRKNTNFAGQGAFVWESQLSQVGALTNSLSPERVVYKAPDYKIHAKEIGGL
jgi:hypothetical protein